MRIDDDMLITLRDVVKSLTGDSIKVIADKNENTIVISIPNVALSAADIYTLKRTPQRIVSYIKDHVCRKLTE